MDQSEVCLVYSVRWSGWSGWSSKFILIHQSSSLFIGWLSYVMRHLRASSVLIMMLHLPVGQDLQKNDKTRRSSNR